MRKFVTALFVSLVMSTAAHAGYIVEPGNFTNVTFSHCDANDKSVYDVSWWKGIGTDYSRIHDNTGKTYGVFTNTQSTQVAIGQDVQLKLSHQNNFTADVRFITHQCGTPPAPTTAPSNFVVTPEQCYGLNDVQWNSVATATEYRVQPAGSTAVLVKTSGTGAMLNVPNTMNVTVKACNAGGCGPESAPKKAYYYNVCH